MRVLVLMSDEGERHLRATLLGPIAVTRVSTEELETALRASRCGLAVIEPCAVRPHSYSSLIKLAARAGARVLLYCRRSPAAAGLIVSAEYALTVELLFFDVDDESDLLRRSLGETAQPSVPALMLHGLRRNVRRMRPVLATATVSLFGGAAIPPSAGEFYLALEEHRRTVQSWVVRAGITCTSDLLWCARIGRLRDALDVKGETLESIADRYGICARTLTAECDRLIGLPPRRAVRELKPPQMARRLVESVTRR